MYRVGLIPSCFGSEWKSQSIYDVFYKYDLKDVGLVNKTPLFVVETYLLPGHLGGGIVYTGDGSVLWYLG